MKIKLRESTELIVSVLLFSTAGFMAASAWNDFFVVALDDYFDEKTGKTLGRFIYAGVLSVTIFIALFLFIQFSNIGRTKALEGVSVF